MATKAATTLKELVISIVGIVIAIVPAVFASDVANWTLDVFNITNELDRAGGLIAVTIVIGPSIAAFATKKYY
jgi:hypothetical protein